MNHRNHSRHTSMFLRICGIAVMLSFWAGTQTQRSLLAADPGNFLRGILQAFGPQQAPGKKENREKSVESIREEARELKPGAEVNQYSPALTKVLVIELNFVNKVCAPAEDQLKKIYEAGQREVNVVALLMGQRQEHNPDWPDGRAMIIAALEKAVEEHCPRESLEKYRAELAARADYRNEALASALISQLDRDVILAPDQWEPLLEAILDNPRQFERLNPQTALYMQFAPRPDKGVVLPLLTPRQQEIFKSLSQTSRIHFGWQADLGIRDNLPVPLEPELPRALRPPMVDDQSEATRKPSTEK